LLAKKYLSPVQLPAAAAIAVTVEAVRNVIVVLVVLVGLFVALAGLLFTLQGFGAVSGSPMSNTTTWSVLGPIIALIGIAIAFAGWVRRKR
jgi:succinate dehydrogenase/fumarate reductase cytochrome b subunit